MEIPIPDGSVAAAEPAPPPSYNDMSGKASMGGRSSYGGDDISKREHRPGAFSSTDRPIAARRRTPSNPSNNRNNSQMSESSVPPEMRVVLDSPVDAELAEASDPVQNALPVVSNPNKLSSSRRRRSSRFSKLMFAGDAQVASAEEEDEKQLRKETWAVVCCILVLIAVAVGVVFAIASPGDDCEDCDIKMPPTEGPASSTSYESARLVLLRDALVHLSPDPSVLQDPTTPQYNALEWIADEDEAVVDVDDMRRLEVRYALAALYYATSGDNWFQNLGFLSPQHECEWFVKVELDENTTSSDGVFCNEDDEVVELKLDGNSLVGSLPPEVKVLSSLRLLNLASNTVRVSGVSTPGLLASDTFRVIAELGNLTALFLADNLFDTTIPTEFGALSTLERLNLERNKFTSSIPTDLSRLSNLKKLWLSYNRLTGDIENILKDLPNLIDLKADYNDLSISPDFLFPKSLTNLRLDQNHLEGSQLTSNIGQLSQLQALGLSRMSLTGSVPTELGMLSNLERLHLESNQLTYFPWSSMNATALQLLDLSSCSFSGQLPSDIGRFSSLMFMDMGSNFFDGSIPESIGDLTSLEILKVSENLLNGTIPSTIGLLTSLRRLTLASNDLSGILPVEMVNMTSLVSVTLDKNDFSGGDIEFICGRENDFGLSTVDAHAWIFCSCCDKI